MKISNSTVAAFSLSKSGSGLLYAKAVRCSLLSKLSLKPLADTNRAVAGPLEHQLRHCKLNIETGALPARGQGGNAPPIFVFAPQIFVFAPGFFSCPPNFFGRKKLLCLGGKNVEICDFGRKSLRISAKTSFFFWRSPAFGRKICDFGQKNSAKTFAP